MTAVLPDVGLDVDALERWLNEEPRHIFCRCVPVGTLGPAACGALGRPLGLPLGMTLPPNSCEACVQTMYDLAWQCPRCRP